MESVQALLIASLAVVPGAIYTWVFERNDGATGDRPAERLLRFVAISLLLSLISTLPIELPRKSWTREPRHAACVDASS
ncbi:DUF6338 family protein [Brevibacterium aurantiacum]|uniref:DUF6338 family protein n=1 Tax=Brevibacterium aurantiacum TaxID=273384 RepID=UPI003B9862D7